MSKYKTYNTFPECGDTGTSRIGNQSLRSTPVTRIKNVDLTPQSKKQNFSPTPNINSITTGSKIKDLKEDLIRIVPDPKKPVAPLNENDNKVWSMANNSKEIPKFLKKKELKEMDDELFKLFCKYYEIPQEIIDYLLSIGIGTHIDLAYYCETIEKLDDDIMNNVETEEGIDKNFIKIQLRKMWSACQKIKEGDTTEVSEQFMEEVDELNPEYRTVEASYERAIYTTVAVLCCFLITLVLVAYSFEFERVKVK